MNHPVLSVSCKILKVMLIGGGVNIQRMREEKIDGKEQEEAGEEDPCEG